MNILFVKQKETLKRGIIQKKRHLRDKINKI